MQWKILPQKTLPASEFPGLSPEILRLLGNRGLDSKDKIENYLNPRYEDLPDPFLFRDMNKLVARIEKAKTDGETVYIFGDYDTDGVCSSVLICETLRLIGIKKVGVYIPHREKEGYGLNPAALDYIKEQGASLLLTVDCGTSSVAPVAYAKNLGMDVIVLDHHEEPAELPKGLSAFLNPHLPGETYPFKGLSACGVAFKATQALWRAFDLPAGQEKWFLDLAAIATVADMMELKEENRNLVKHGILVLNKTRRLGLQELLKSARLPLGGLGVYEIGFMIAPRLNAAGRMDHANVSYELLEASDRQVVRELALSLNSTNASRQTETERIVKEALASQVSKQYEQGKIFLLAAEENWQAGVVGLVSSRITEKFHRPSAVITKTEKGWVGSGRSISGFDITRALAQASEFLEKFGGHEGACGFSLKSPDLIPDFHERLDKIARARIAPEDLEKKLVVDLELGLEKITPALVAEIEKLAPFGIGNPRPRFVSFAVRVASVFAMGREGQHLRLRVEQNGIEQEAVLFGSDNGPAAVLAAGDLMDIVYEIGFNEWNGTRRIQLKIIDIGER